MSSKTSILLDSDVIIHFTKAEKLGLLTDYYRGRLLVLSEVVEELSVFPASRTAIDNLILYKRVSEFECSPQNRDLVIKEYARIKKLHNSGTGETMCMVVARFEDKIIASSNRRDIEPYCLEHSITYMTTLDLLYEIYLNGGISEADIDLFIYDVTSKGSKLAYKTLADYKASKGILT